MEKEENKKLIIESKLGNQEQELERARKKTDELADAYQRLKSVQEALQSGQATPGQFQMFQELQNTYGSLEKLGASFDKALSKQDLIEQKVMQTKNQYSELNSKVAEYKQKIESIKIQKQVAEVDRLKESFNRVGNSVQKSIKNVARLALGVFGVRSAYLALRRAASDLASYDPQFAANLEYIRYALTQAIAPALRYLVNLAGTLLSYINAILQGWFGINIFANSSAKSFNKMKAGASGVAKAAKEIKKQLMGFDEMNVLQDNTDSGSGGGAGGASMPSFDLSQMNAEPPAWLQWIIDHKDEIIATLLGIATALTLIKLGLDPIQSLGLGLMVMGVVYAIESLLDYLNDPSWENFGKIIQGVGIAIIGLGVLIGSVPLIVAGAIVLIVGTIIKYWDKIKKFFQDGIDWLTGKSDWVHQMFGDTIGNIYDIFVDNLQLILDWFDLTFTSIKGIFDGFIKFVKGVFTGDWKMVWEGIKQIFSNTWDWIKGTANTMLQLIWNNVKSFATAVGSVVANIFKSIVNAVLRTIENVLNSPIRTINSLIGVINAIPRYKYK